MKSSKHIEIQREINFNSLTEKSLVGIYLIQDGVFKYVNPKFAEIFEYNVNELLNIKGPADLTFPEDWPLVECNISRRLKGEIESANFEFRGVTKNNKIINVEVFGSFEIYNEKPAILGTFLNITERQKLIDELKEREKKFKDLAEMLPQMIFEIDSSGNIIYANKNALEATGYSYEELENGLSALRIIHPSERDNAYKDIFEILKGKTLYNREYTILTKNGSTFPSEISASPIQSEKGIIGLRGFIIDKTESKKSQEQLRILSRAVEQSPVAIIITDLNGNIEYTNPKFQHVTGYSPDEVIGKNPKILSSGTKPEAEYEILWKTIKSGNDWIGEFRNKKKNGELYWASALISPVKDSKGNITHFLALAEDITERKKTEMELRSAKEKAEEMNRLKSVFLANMSHELRTPMIGILGYAETLYGELKEPVFKEMAATLLKSGNRLKETLNLILDLSRIEANKIDINLTTLDIAQILQEIVKLFEVAAAEKKLKLNLIILDENVVSKLDKRLFIQIVENLINNAIKYTVREYINVYVKRISEHDKEYSVIEIEDTGIGISPENIELIFEPFRQASEGYARDFEGTGLGLTITKKFVELLNGQISVESKLGAGSKFTLKFISAVIRKPEISTHIYGEDKEPHMEKKKGNHSLLLVENDIPSIDIIKIYLQNKYNIDSAVNGLTALNMIGEKKYSAILMDIDLGFGMNGIEVAQKIRKIEGYENIPIIAVTAYAMMGDKEKFLNAGCTHYIAKPFDRHALIDLLGEALSG